MQLDLENFQKYQTIIGCDEVGRGPLAGPVVGCAVRVQKSNFSFLEGLGLNDSKKLTEKKRESIVEKLDLELTAFTPIDRTNFSYCIWEHSPEEIDELNILQASLSAMKNSAVSISKGEEKVLIDGNKTFEFPNVDIEYVIKGDSKSLVIGLASIIAKVYRDRLMKIFGEEFPGYGLESHAGYPTKFHKEAIAKLGVTPIHRKTFKGVKEFI